MTLEIRARNLRAELTTEFKPDVKVTYNPQSVEDPSRQLVETLNLWFIPPSDPVYGAVVQYCVKNEIHWHIAVKRFLEKALREEGCLK